MAMLTQITGLELLPNLKWKDMTATLDESTTAPELDLSNYEVRYGTFGPFTIGDVIPLWWLQQKKHHIPTLLDNGVIVRTNKPVPEHCHAKMVGDAPKTELDPTPSMQHEIDRLKGECERLAQDNRLLVAERNELKDQRKLSDQALGKQTMEIGRLTQVLQQANARAEFAEKQLADLTKPRPAPEKPPEAKAESEPTTSGVPTPGKKVK